VLAGNEYVFGTYYFRDGEFSNGSATDSAPIERVNATNSTRQIWQALSPTPSFSQQIVGPASAFTMHATAGGPDDLYLFAGNGLTDGSEGIERIIGGVVYRKLNDSSWTDLGAPPARIGQVFPPLAFGFYWGNPALSAGAANVFTVTDNTNGGFTLWDKHLGSNGVWASSWHANPPAPTTEEYHLQTVMLWWDGAPYTSTLHQNLWGLTTSGELVEYYWNGASWQWGALRTLPAGYGTKIVSVSSGVIDTAGYKRLSLFVRTDTGRVLEYAYGFDGTSWWGWSWFDLSTYNTCSIFRF
jgi:hypothetical protein